jgi:hypothetical protein
MNASRFLVSAATAIAVVGAAGFAYAQTTSPATGATTDPQTQNQAPMSNAAMPANSNMPSQSASDVNGTMNSGTMGTTTRGANGHMNRNSTRMHNGMNSNGASGTMGNGSNDNSSSTELPARAARN